MLFNLVLYFFAPALARLISAASPHSEVPSSSITLYNSSSYEVSPVAFPGSESLDDVSVFISNVEGPLDLLSFFMNAVKSMKNLALRNFMGDMNPQEYIFREWPDIAMEFEPLGSQFTIKTRYAIWGLYRSVTSARISRRVFNCKFLIKYQTNWVAEIHVYDPRRRPLKAEENRSPVNQNEKRLNPHLSSSNETSSLSVVIDNTNAKTPSNYRLDLAFSFFGARLSFPNLADVTLATMAYAAEKGAASRFPGVIQHISSTAGITVDVECYGGCPRASPPFFQYQHLIQAMAQIPQHSLDHRSFYEAEILISVNRQPVGNITVRRSAPNGQAGSKAIFAQPRVEIS